MNRSFRFGFGLALAAGTTFSASAVVNTVPRALNGLVAADTLVNGNFQVGLRGAAVGNPIDVTKQAWIGILEVDSDDRRTTTSGVSTNGFDNTHPALAGTFDIIGSINDAVGDNAVAANGGSHATGVAGIILSRDGTNTGMATRARGVMGLSDDVGRLFYAVPRTKLVPDPAIPADWSQMQASLNYLNTFPSDVINASIQYNNIPTGAATTRAVVQADLNGAGFPSRMFDKLSFVSDRTFVVAAGNSGGLPSLAADIYNGIVVGALVQVPGGGGIADLAVANYSGRGALANGRNGVMIVAGGSQVTSTAWNHAGANPDFINIGNGTSFAAPLVSGAAGILWSAGKQAIGAGARTDHNDPFVNNHRVLKAVLLNSARKISVAVQGGGAAVPWSPGLVDAGDDKRWLRPLNYDVGAGELDTKAAWKQYREANVPNPNGEMTRHFWDNDTNITSNVSSISYQSNLFGNFIVPAAEWITSMTATLVWDRQVTNATLAAPGLSDLDLRFQYTTDNGLSWLNILSSVSTADSAEHIFKTGLASFGANTIYRLNVEVFGLAAGIVSEPFALAVRYNTIPTPGALALAFAGVFAAGRRRR